MAESKGFSDYYVDSLTALATAPARYTNSFGTGMSPEAFTANAMDRLGNLQSRTVRRAGNALDAFIPGANLLASGLDVNSGLNPAEIFRNVAAGGLAVGGAMRVAKVAGSGLTSALNPQGRFGRIVTNLAPSIPIFGAVTNLTNTLNNWLPQNYTSNTPATTPAATGTGRATPSQSSMDLFKQSQLAFQMNPTQAGIDQAYQLYLQAANQMKNNRELVPQGFAEWGNEINRRYGISNEVTPVGPGSLSPSEIEYFARQQRELRRRAGQASATDELQEKQARAQAQRQMGDLRAFMTTAPQDMAVAAANLGPAAELGYGRTLERDISENIGDVKTNLQEYLARQNLAKRQRGSDVSAGLSDIELAKAAQLEQNKANLVKYMTGA